MNEKIIFNHTNPLYRFYEEVINQKKLHVLDELFCENYINHIAPSNIDNDFLGVKKLISEQVQAFPDCKITVIELFQFENKFIAKWRFTGTHTNDYFGIKPTGKKFCMEGVDIETIINGKISEHDGAEDMLGLLQQIGAVTVLTN